MAKIIPVPAVTGNSESNEFGSDAMQVPWPAGRTEFETTPFIEQGFDFNETPGNKTF